MDYVLRVGRLPFVRGERRASRRGHAPVLSAAYRLRRAGAHVLTRVGQALCAVTPHTTVWGERVRGHEWTRTGTVITGNGLCCLHCGATTPGWSQHTKPVAPVRPPSKTIQVAPMSEAQVRRLG